MSFDWSKYLEVAQTLTTITSQDTAYREATLRAAISRAYYAAFGSARTFARDEETFSPVGDGSDHARLQSYFKRSATATTDKDERLLRRKIAFELERLHDNRKLADYKDIVSGLEAITKTSLALSMSIITALENL